MTLAQAPRIPELLGLELTIARLAGNMRNFGFGAIRPAPKGGTIGDFALHIQCPWRIDGPDGIYTGGEDLYVYAGGEQQPENWSYEAGNSLQTARLDSLLGPRIGSKRAYYYASGIKVVETDFDEVNGDLFIAFSSGHQLRVFPQSAETEQWRLLRPSDESPHLVFGDRGEN